MPLNRFATESYCTKRDDVVRNDIFTRRRRIQRRIDRLTLDNEKYQQLIDWRQEEIAKVSDNTKGRKVRKAHMDVIERLQVFIQCNQMQMTKLLQAGSRK